MSDRADVGARTWAELRRFVENHSVPAPVPLVPEIAVRVASEVTPLWHATDAWLAREAIEPPFWAFPWAGGQVLARYVIDTPARVAGLRVLDFACGGGIVALAASRAGAREVRAVDTDALAVAATRLNAEAAGAAVEAHMGDWVDQELAAGVDVLLAGDVFYDARATARFVPWFRALVRSGVVVLAGDPGRAYAPTEGATVAFEADVPVPEGLEGKTTLRARVLEIHA